MWHILYEEMGERAGKVTLPPYNMYSVGDAVWYSHHYVTQSSRVGDHLHLEFSCS